MFLSTFLTQAKKLKRVFHNTESLATSNLLFLAIKRFLKFDMPHIATGNTHDMVVMLASHLIQRLITPQKQFLDIPCFLKRLYLSIDRRLVECIPATTKHVSDLLRRDRLFRIANQPEDDLPRARSPETGPSELIHDSPNTLAHNSYATKLR